MSLLNNKYISVYRDIDLEAFYEIAPKYRWMVIFAHVMLHLMPVLIILLYFWNVADGEFIVHALIIGLIFYSAVIFETAAYLFPSTRNSFKNIFPWFIIPLSLFGGYLGYEFGYEIMGSALETVGQNVFPTKLLFIGLIGSLGVFIWTYLGVSLILKASRVLYTKKASAEADIRFASEVQQKILQDIHVEKNDTKAYACSLPANELGGDYFELSAKDDTIFATVGDISGHSFGAGLLMTMTKSAVQTHLLYQQDPAQILSALNKMLVRQSDRSMYATMTVLSVDTSNFKATLSNAGHPPVFHIPKYSQTIQKRTIKGLGLGILDKAEYSNTEFEVEKGDLIILYSDGLFEIRDEQGQIRDSDFFEEIITNLDPHSLDSPKIVAESILAEVKKADHSDSFEDDATLIVIEV